MRFRPPPLIFAAMEERESRKMGREGTKEGRGERKLGLGKDEFVLFLCLVDLTNHDPMRGVAEKWCRLRKKIRWVSIEEGFF